MPLPGSSPTLKGVEDRVLERIGRGFCRGEYPARSLVDGGSMNNTRLWTRDFVFIAATTFFVAMTFYLLMTTMAVYAIERFAASESLAGLSAGMFVIGALVSRVLAGKYMEVIGRKRLLYASLVLFLVATLLYLPINDLTLLLIVRFIHGTAFGAATTILATAVMDIIPDERRGEGTSYFSLSPTLATAIGPFLGLFITQHADYEVMFIVCALFSVLAIVMTVFSRIPEARMTPQQREAMSGFVLQDFFERSAVPLSIVMLIMGMAYSGILAFLNPYAREIGMIGAASFFFIVYSVFILVSRPFTGRLLDARGDNIVMCPALLIFVLGLVVLAGARHGAVLLLAGALVGLGFGTCMSCIQAIVIKRSPRHRIGLATSTFFFCADAGMGVGPYLVGGIIPLLGFRGMYLALSGMVFLGFVLYCFVHGKRAGVRSAPGTGQELTPGVGRRGAL